MKMQKQCIHTVMLAALVVMEAHSVGAWFFDTPDNIGQRSSGRKGLPSEDIAMQKKSILGMLVTDDDTEPSKRIQDKVVHQELQPFSDSQDGTLVFVEKTKKSHISDDTRLHRLKADIFQKIRQLQQYGIYLLQDDRTDEQSN